MPFGIRISNRVIISSTVRCAYCSSIHFVWCPCDARMLGQNAKQNVRSNSFCHTWCRCQRREYSYCSTIAPFTTYLLFHFPDSRTSSLLHRHPVFFVFTVPLNLRVLAVCVSWYNSIFSIYSGFSKMLFVSYARLYCTQFVFSECVSMLSWNSLPSQVQCAAHGKIVVLLHFKLLESHSNAKRPTKESKNEQTNFRPCVFRMHVSVPTALPW